jgi:hypothetical protein
MIFLHRYVTEPDGSQVVDIAVVERDAHVARYEGQGFIRCTLEEFRAAWRRRDEDALARMRAAVPPLERAVGQPGS